MSTTERDTQRRPGQPARSRVSTLELFFDLVFVFTVTQVVSTIVEKPGLPTVGHAALELSVVFWMYGGFAWLTNLLGSEKIRLRILLLLGMAALLVVSLAIPRAFTDDALLFGVAYLALNIVHLIGFFLGGRVSVAQAIRSVSMTNLLACLVLIGAGFAPEEWRWVLWVVAVLTQWAPGGISASRFDIDADHFGERHGLMVLIVLGESLISVAEAAEHHAVDAGLIIGVLCGLACATAIWWCYFSGDDERAAASYRPRRGRNALTQYDLPHLLVMAGILGIAAGSRLSLPELLHPTDSLAAWLVAGGAALSLAGLALFRSVVGFASPLTRIMCAVVVLASVPIGRHVGCAEQLAAVAVVVALMLLVERRLATPPPGAPA